MNLALYGNNDGPLRLARALAGSPFRVVWLGVQKPLRPRVREAFAEVLARTPVQWEEREQGVMEALAHHEVDVFINCFGNFRFREVHRAYRSFNVHLAPLPAYRGRHPLRWALINGETSFGYTIHAINDDFDDGKIYWQKTIPVRNGWSARQLRTALVDQLESDFRDFLTGLPTNPGRLNDPAKATYVTRRYPADGEVDDWTDRDAVYRKVMALRHDDHPAFGRIEDRKISFLSATPSERRFVGFRPATVVGRGPRAVEVVCADGYALWLEVRPEERPPVNTKFDHR